MAGLWAAGLNIFGEGIQTSSPTYRRRRRKGRSPPDEAWRLHQHQPAHPSWPVEHHDVTTLRFFSESESKLDA